MLMLPPVAAGSAFMSEFGALMEIDAVSVPALPTAPTGW
jgi:hypothetical protein